MKAIEFKQKGYGQWEASTIHYGKEISMHFTDAPTYDLIKSKKIGYKSTIKWLRSGIIRYNKIIKNGKNTL